MKGRNNEPQRLRPSFVQPIDAGAGRQSRCRRVLPGHTGDLRLRRTHLRAVVQLRELQSGADRRPDRRERPAGAGLHREAASEHAFLARLDDPAPLERVHDPGVHHRLLALRITRTALGGRDKNVPACSSGRFKLSFCSRILPFPISLL